MNDQDLVPDRLGAYRLLDRIGEGGMGVVFLARDPGHRTVALKVLRSSVAGDPTARRRLAREVETMQRVRSPNVAEVIDADLGGEMPYIVTRFVAGRTLDDVVTQDGPLRGPDLARLASGLAEALVAVHAAGVVHRDVKPGNVMLFQGMPVVIDFGIAQGPDATRLTMTGMFMGTPGYLAPEVIEGRPSSEASDVHAWGATVAFAATGRPPFGTGPYEGIFYRIVNGQADLDGAPVPMLPLLAAALAKDPAHRPSAVQLRAQAAVLDPGTLVQGLRPAAQAASAALNGAGVTRSDVAPGAAYPAAGAATILPPAVVGGDGATVMPAMSPGDAAAAAVPGVATAGPPAGPGLAPAANGAGPGPIAPSTQPLAQATPLPDDLRDVLTPVRYADRAAAAREPATAIAPGAGAVARPVTAAPGPRAGDPATRARWHPVLVAASVLVVASVSVILPVAGTLGALALFAALRTAGLAQRRTTARRQARGSRASDPIVTVMSLPWFLIRAVLALLLLAPFALAAAALAAGVTVALAPADWPYRALAYAAGALVIFYGLGPGSGVPRTQLRRFFGMVTKTPVTRAVAVIAMIALAAAALTAAASWPSAFWPATVPGTVIRFGVAHLGPLRRLAYLAHLGGPHRFGVLHGNLLRSPLLRHLVRGVF